MFLSLTFSPNPTASAEYSSVGHKQLPYWKRIFLSACLHVWSAAVCTSGGRIANEGSCQDVLQEMAAASPHIPLEGFVLLAGLLVHHM